MTVDTTGYPYRWVVRQHGDHPTIPGGSATLTGAMSQVRATWGMVPEPRLAAIVTARSLWLSDDGQTWRLDHDETAIPSSRPR